METACRAGQEILYVGSSNFAGWHIAQAQAAAADRHFTGLVSEQSIYNLLVRDIELEVIPAAQHYGLGLIPWSPLQGGLLGGVLTKGEEGVRRLTGRAKDSLDEHHDAIEAYKNWPSSSASSRRAGLAWLLHQPAVTAPIVGPRIAEQLDGALKRLTWSSPGVLDRLDELFPGRRRRRRTSLVGVRAAQPPMVDGMDSQNLPPRTFHVLVPPGVGHGQAFWREILSSRRPERCGGSAASNRGRCRGPREAYAAGVSAVSTTSSPSS